MIKNFLQQHGKKLFLSFLIGAALPTGWAQLAGANVSDSNPYAALGETTAQELFVEFHKRANEIVNEKLALLLDEKSEPDVSFVDATQCGPTNASTFCLGVELSKELAWVQEMAEVAREQVTFTADSETLLLEGALQEVSRNRSQIDQELLLAEDSIDLTLSVYNQIMMVYPLHVELIDLINNVTTYRDKLAAIRTVVTDYPAKFHDATMVQCK